MTHCSPRIMKNGSRRGGGHVQAWPRRWPLPTSGSVPEMIMKRSERGGSHAAALGISADAFWDGGRGGTVREAGTD